VCGELEYVRAVVARAVAPGCEPGCEPRRDSRAFADVARRPELTVVRPAGLTYVRLVTVGSERGASSYGALDDAALGTLIAARDPAALEELYDRCGSASYSLARRIIADEQLAHDVVQEVFLAIWRGTASYDGSRGTLTSWLFALTHHKAVDAVRRAQRHSGRRAPESALDTEVDSAPGVEERTLDAMKHERVRAAVDELPEPQRKALLLAYFGGYSQSEIAQLTQTPLGTVKTRTLAALRRLRVALSDVEERIGSTDATGEGRGA